MDDQETAKDRQGPRDTSDVAGGPYKSVSPNFVHEIEMGCPTQALLVWEDCIDKSCKFGRS
jgi:hypothetical protein